MNIEEQLKSMSKRIKELEKENKRLKSEVAVYNELVTEAAVKEESEKLPEATPLDEYDGEPRDSRDFSDEFPMYSSPKEQQPGNRDELDEYLDKCWRSIKNLRRPPMLTDVQCRLVFADGTISYQTLYFTGDRFYLNLPFPKRLFIDLTDYVTDWRSFNEPTRELVFHRTVVTGNPKP